MSENIYIRLKPKSKEQPHGTLSYPRIKRHYEAGVWKEEKPSAGRDQLVAYLSSQLPHDGSYRDFQQPLFEIVSASEYRAIQERELRRRNAAAQGIMLDDAGLVKAPPVLLPDPSLLAEESEPAPLEPMSIKAAAPSLDDLGLGGGDADDEAESSEQTELFASTEAPSQEPAAPKAAKKTK
jgi:hypothetical protein